MNKNFYQKTGMAIEYIANELYILKKGDRMPSISDFQKQFSISRGTVQNALSFLKDEEAIVTKSRGHMGTHIEEIDYTILQKYVALNQITGTMPLPYSKLYEGLATGLYLSFLKEETKLNIAYIRGSDERVHTLENDLFDFTVISRFAAEEMIEKGKEIDIVLSFGPRSYLSRHVLIFRPGIKLILKDDLRVGIDTASLDHAFLTNQVFQDYDVDFIELPGNQMIHLLRDDQIDVAIWNHDELIDKNIQDMRFNELPASHQYDEIGEAVVVCRKHNRLISTILNRILSVKEIRRIQEEVKQNILIPRY